MHFNPSENMFAAGYVGNRETSYERVWEKTIPLQKPYILEKGF